MLLPQRFLAAVVAIGTDAPDGSRLWVASGTHYARMNRADPLQTEWFLVTNKHVIDGLETAYIRANTWDPGAAYPLGLAKEMKLSLREGGREFWYRHPDPEVDIAVTPINIGYLTRQGVGIYFFENDTEVLTRAQISDAELSEGDGIYALGFPMGMVGEDRNYVIARSGSIARLQDTLAGRSKTFLIDASVYPGQSGGPVISRPQVSSLPGTQAFSEARLLGIVAGYVTFRDVAVSLQTQQHRITFEENSGLAQVYPVDYIDEAIDAIPIPEPPEAPAELASPAPDATDQVPPSADGS